MSGEKIKFKEGTVVGEDLELYHKGVEITSTATELNKLDGVESVAAELDSFHLCVTMADLSTAESVWVVSPYAATIEKVYSVIDATIATANGAITLEIAGTAVTGGAITIAYSGSNAGDVDSCTPTAARTVTAGQAIEVLTSGAPTNTCITTFTLVMKRT